MTSLRFVVFLCAVGSVLGRSLPLESGEVRDAGSSKEDEKTICISFKDNSTGEVQHEKDEPPTILILKLLGRSKTKVVNYKVLKPEDFFKNNFTGTNPNSNSRDTTYNSNTTTMFADKSVPPNERLDSWSGEHRNMSGGINDTKGSSVVHSKMIHTSGRNDAMSVSEKQSIYTSNSKGYRETDTFDNSLTGNDGGVSHQGIEPMENLTINIASSRKNESTSHRTQYYGGSEIMYNNTQIARREPFNSTNEGPPKGIKVHTENETRDITFGKEHITRKGTTEFENTEPVATSSRTNEAHGYRDQTEIIPLDNSDATPPIDNNGNGNKINNVTQASTTVSASLITISENVDFTNSTEMPDDLSNETMGAIHYNEINFQMSNGTNEVLTTSFPSADYTSMPSQPGSLASVHEYSSTTTTTDTFKSLVTQETKEKLLDFSEGRTTVNINDLMHSTTTMIPDSTQTSHEGIAINGSISNSPNSLFSGIEETEVSVLQKVNASLISGDHQIATIAYVTESTTATEETSTIPIMIENDFRAINESHDEINHGLTDISNPPLYHPSTPPSRTDKFGTTTQIASTPTEAFMSSEGVEVSPTEYVTKDTGELIAVVSGENDTTESSLLDEIVADEKLPLTHITSTVDHDKFTATPSQTSELGTEEDTFSGVQEVYNKVGGPESHLVLEADKTTTSMYEEGIQKLLPDPDADDLHSDISEVTTAPKPDEYKFISTNYPQVKNISILTPQSFLTGQPGLNNFQEFSPLTTASTRELDDWKKFNNFTMIFPTGRSFSNPEYHQTSPPQEEPGYWYQHLGNGYMRIVNLQRARRI